MQNRRPGLSSRQTPEPPAVPLVQPDAVFDPSGLTRNDVRMLMVRVAYHVFGGVCQLVRAAVNMDLGPPLPLPCSPWTAAVHSYADDLHRHQVRQAAETVPAGRPGTPGTISGPRPTIPPGPPQAHLTNCPIL